MQRSKTVDIKAPPHHLYQRHVQTTTDPNGMISTCLLLPFALLFASLDYSRRKNENDTPDPPSGSYRRPAQGRRGYHWKGDFAMYQGQGIGYRYGVVFSFPERQRQTNNPEIHHYCHFGIEPPRPSQQVLFCIGDWETGKTGKRRLCESQYCSL